MGVGTGDVGVGTGGVSESKVRRWVDQFLVLSINGPRKQSSHFV